MIDKAGPALLLYHPHAKAGIAGGFAKAAYEDENEGAAFPSFITMEIAHFHPLMWPARAMGGFRRKPESRGGGPI